MKEVREIVRNKAAKKIGGIWKVVEGKIMTSFRQVELVGKSRSEV